TASYCSFGIVFNADKIFTINKGAPNQILIITATQNAKFGLDKKSIGWETNPILTKKFGKKPLTPFNIHFQVKPVTIAGNAHGIINNVLYIPLNLLILFMAKAAAKPTSTCPVIEKKVHLMEVKNAL